jgi:hypothetical protein
VGDPAAPATIDLVTRLADGTFVPLTEDAPLPIVVPPQSGQFVLPGVRAHNMQTCGVQLTMGLRDECTGTFIGSEGRPVNLVVLDGADAADGAGPADPTQISNFANVAVCPNNSSSRNVQDERYMLEAVAIDRDGRTATAKVHVIPYCADPSALAVCQCTCTRGYTGPCATPPPDAGMPGVCP